MVAVWKLGVGRKRARVLSQLGTCRQDMICIKVCMLTRPGIESAWSRLISVGASWFWL